jgi:hypothetical protein
MNILVSYMTLDIFIIDFYRTKYCAFKNYYIRYKTFQEDYET